jgi:RNA polymerase sigma factor (sigma-70 family)
MQQKPDAQLLRAHIQGDDAAFREIVSRHTDLVYSAALRQVNSPSFAQDIAQSVFVDLVRKSSEVSARMANDASLAGWLYRSTRFAVLNHLRDEHRRAEHERQAMEQLFTDSSPAADWERIRPVLDEAMAELSDADRDALLLRFFKNHDFQTVGRALGLSDDAAQKRVTRAVERLRKFFAKRGVAIGAAGLVVLISANAVQAAPPALSALISTAAILTGTAAAHTSTAITATKVIAMTTLQKTIVTATIAVLVGTTFYETRRTSKLADQISTLQEQQAPLMAQNQQLQHERDEAVSRLAAMGAENQPSSDPNAGELLKLRAEVGQLRDANSQLSSVTNDSRAALVKSWLERRDQLKQLVETYPDKSIPEFQMLSEEQWLNAAMSAKFDTEKNKLQDLADLRRTAENNVASAMHEAVTKYAKTNGGQFPTDLSQLQPYFKSPLDQAILDRWQIQPQSALPNQAMGGDWVITEKSPVDSALDNRFAIGIGGYGSTTYPSTEISSAIAILNPAVKAYAAANNGKEPTEPSQILPYLTTPEQQAALQKLIQSRDTP